MAFKSQYTFYFKYLFQLSASFVSRLMDYLSHCSLGVIGGILVGSGFVAMVYLYKYGKIYCVISYQVNMTLSFEVCTNSFPMESLLIRLYYQITRPKKKWTFSNELSLPRSPRILDCHWDL